MIIKKLVFATSNSNKVREVQAILGDIFKIENLESIGCFEEIPETQPTVKGNALQKARYVVENYKVDCFAEDTGFEIDALGGEPGVYSARYAGKERDAEANMALVLKKMEGQTNRQARFRTVIALVLDKKEYTFEGVINGVVSTHKKGNNGFGYDPIFIPDGYSQSFGQIDIKEKNGISHRCLLYTSPSPRDLSTSRMPSSA